MKKLSILLTTAVLCFISLTAFVRFNYTTQTISFEQITIGKQVWMASNLNIDKFRNGEIIPHAKTKEEWKKAGDNKQPAWCYYDNNPANGEKYGKLYNWYAVSDPRGLSPKGWHIPSDAEWTKLVDYLGGVSVAGGKMKSTTGWGAPNKGASNSSGFAGLPGGSRLNSGTFSSIGSYGTWWSSTEYKTNYAWPRTLDCFSGDITRYNNYKAGGASVRCIKD